MSSYNRLSVTEQAQMRALHEALQSARDIAHQLRISPHPVLNFLRKPSCYIRELAVVVLVRFLHKTSVIVANWPYYSQKTWPIGGSQYFKTHFDSVNPSFGVSAVSEYASSTQTTDNHKLARLEFAKKNRQRIGAKRVFSFNSNFSMDSMYFVITSTIIGLKFFDRSYSTMKINLSRRTGRFSAIFEKTESSFQSVTSSVVLWCVGLNFPPKLDLQLISSLTNCSQYQEILS
jgi:hypothetical protein